MSKSRSKNTNLEFFSYKGFQVQLVISILIFIVADLFKIKQGWLIKTASLGFILGILLFGFWMTMGTIFRWNSFIKSYTYRGWEFEASIEGYGSLIYIILGICACLFALYMIFHVAVTDLEILEEEFRKKY